eukprot:gene28280-35035_t
MLDVDGDGEVTYKELIHAIKEGLAASSAAKERGNAATNQVLHRLADYIRGDKASAEKVFRHFDKDSSGYLNRGELLRLTRQVLPGITPQEQRLFLSHMQSVDANGDGKISFHELLKALKLIPRSIRPRAGAGGGAAGGGGDGYDVSDDRRVQVLQDEVAALRHKLAEIPRLRRELADAKAACAELEEAVAMDTGRIGDLVHNGNLAGDFSEELKGAWEKVTVLQRRYAEVTAAHAVLKGHHERAVQQLDETHRRLNDERKANLKLTAEEKRLAMELEAVRGLEPMLEKAQQERYALEKEYNELATKAMMAPAASVQEAKSLRLQVAEQQRERAGIELKLAEVQKELGEVKQRGSVSEDTRLLKSERDGARLELERARLELEMTREKLALYERIKVRSVRGSQEQSPAVAPTAAASSTLDSDQTREEVLRELNHLREEKAEQLEELRKAQKLLHLEEAQTEDLRQELEEVKQRGRVLEAELRRKLQ